MNSLQKQLIEISTESGEIFNEVNDEDLIGAHRLLHVRLKNPKSYVTLIGETGSGKSTLINGFLNQEILPRMARPTTGAVTQIVNDFEKKEPKYYAINNNGTMEPLGYDIFRDLSIKPDDDLLRLQVQISPKEKDYDGLNLFDTPGYNSLIEKHEEILRDFIPESDVIIYVINHRVGFGIQDQILLSSIKDYIDDMNIPVFFVINRCPETETLKSRRTKEIILHASDSLHKTIKPFLVNSIIQNEEEDKPVFPQAQKLWNKVNSIISDKDRFEILLKNGKKALTVILNELQLNLEQKTQIAKLNNSELMQLREFITDFSNTKKTLINILEKYCSKWEKSLPKIINIEFDNLFDSTKSKINESNKWLDVNACTAYITGHHLQYGVRDINRKIEYYLENELESMNKEMEDVANQAIKKLSQSINLLSSKSIEIVIATLIKKIGITVAGEVSKNFIKNLGGRGGVAAGMGNLAKMFTKRLGNLFGKTFGREVYRNIGKIFNKQMITKINVAVIIIWETGSYICDSKTWQKKLIKKIRDEFGKLKTDLSDNVVSDVIENIKKANEDCINELYDKLKIDVENDILSLKHSDAKKELEKANSILNKVINIKIKLGEIE